MGDGEPTLVAGLRALALLAGVLLVAWTVLHAWRRRSELRAGWRRGLWLGAGITALYALSLAAGLSQPRFGFAGTAVFMAWEILRTGACAALAQAAAQAPGVGLPGLGVAGLATRRGWAATLGVTAGSLALTSFLFHVTQAQPSAAVVADAAGTPALATIPKALHAAFGEEVVYRLGGLSLLALKLSQLRGGIALAVGITAVAWTGAHAGSTDPEWVKLAQILPIGLALGWLARRHGVAACFLAHAVLNLGTLVPGVLPDSAVAHRVPAGGECYTQ
jgi:hypothetical protein